MNRISYEWIVEEVDTHGDIFNTSAWDSLRDAKSYASSCAGFCSVRIALRRNIGDMWGDLIDWDYAYLDKSGTVVSDGDAHLRFRRDKLASLSRLAPEFRNA